MNLSCFDEAGNFVMQIEPKLVGTVSVKSSATTQAHSAVSELRISTCQCTCTIFVLDDEMELQMRSWLKGFIVQSCASFSF